MDSWLSLVPVGTLVLGLVLGWVGDWFTDRRRFARDERKEQTRQHWQIRYEVWRKKHEDYRAARRLLIKTMREVSAADDDHDAIRKLPAFEIIGQLETLLPYVEELEGVLFSYRGALHNLVYASTDREGEGPWTVDHFKQPFFELSKELLGQINTKMEHLPVADSRYHL